MARIEVFADIMCPFTHVSLRRLVEARRARGVRAPVRVRAWPLEWVNGQPISREVAAREIEALRAAVAPDLFAAFESAPYPRSSIPAFGLVAAAYTVDEAVGEEVSLAVRDAVFEQGLDVADFEVLLAVGEPWGVVPFPQAVAESIVEVDRMRGVERGVQGSPHFFVGDRGWFCPSLEIRHDAGTFGVTVVPEAMNEFYEAALT